MFSNILIYFVVIPLAMLLGLALCRDIKQIRTVAVTGSVALTALSVWLLVEYLCLRHGGADAPMLFTGSWDIKFEKSTFVPRKYITANGIADYPNPSISTGSCRK